MIKTLLNKTAKFLIFPISLLIIFLGFSFKSSIVKAEGEIEIYTLEDLDNVRNDLTASYVLMNDLDFNNDSDYENVANKTTWTTGEGWSPIGIYPNYFTGTLNGQDYTISNLYINKPLSDNAVGLFGDIGDTSPATISNLNLTSVTITGKDSVGAITGHNFKGVVTDCSVTGSVSGSYYVGGITGYNEQGTTTNSDFTGSVDSDASGYMTGGLVGYNVDYDEVSTISNCHTSGTVTGPQAIGGLVGYNEGSIIEDSSSTSTINGLAGTDTYYAGGLVGYNDWNISDSYATGAVTGTGNSEYLGGFAGESYGTISNSYSTGDVTGSGASYDIAGFVGVNDWEITNCFATGDVEGMDWMGGLVGDNFGTISNSYATGSVTGNEDIGGLVGYSDSTIDSSYSTGVVTGNTDPGGLVGLNDGGTVTNSFWDTQTSGMDISSGGTGKTTTEMKTISTFNDTGTTGLNIAWDISLIGDFDELDPTTWFIDASTDYPRLFMEYVEPADPPGPTEIYTLEDLNSIRNDLTASYVLMNDLDFNDDTDYENLTNKTTWTTGEGWVPIGTYSTPFSGTLNGQDFTISNLLIDTPTDIYDVGLFGGNSGTIQNLNISDADVTGHDNPSPTPGEFTGILVGYNTGDITNCSSTGTVSTDGNNGGGLVGFHEVGTISDSHSDASVTYTGGNYKDAFGGLVGKMLGGGTIDNCYATGDVTELNSTHTATSAGGLSGVNEGSSTITDSYATGNVTGFYGTAGGLVGYNYNSSVSNSYATGSIEALVSKVGGLIGYAYTSNISTSFATGSVEGDDYVGGLIGSVSSTSSGSFISDCYATGAVTENDNTDPGGDGYGVGALIGYALGYTRIDNSYATGYIDSAGLFADDVGGLVGDTNSPYVTNSFWDTETTGRTESPVGTGKTTAEMKTISTFNDTGTEGLDTAWDISLIGDFDELNPTNWFIDDSTDYPRLFMQYEEPEEEPPDEPVIEEDEDAQGTTSTATNITTTGAQLNGNLSTLGTYDNAEVYFQYRKSGESWISTNKISRTSTGSFSKVLSNLDIYTNYEFRAVVEFGQSSMGYGSTSSFTTLKVDLTKVVITDLGLINDVPNLDDMLYYFTSQTPLIKGTAYPNSNVKFETDDEEFSTQVDTNGQFEISLDLPRGTTELTYFSYSTFGNQSQPRTLTLVIGVENFPDPDNGDEDITDPDTEPDTGNTEEENTNDEVTIPEDEKDTMGIKTIKFSDASGNPLVGAEVTIDGRTYTTDNNGEILAEGLKDEKYSATIKYKGKEYTQDILAIQGMKTEITIELDKSIDWIKILIYTGSGGILLLILFFIFRRKNNQEEQY